MPKDKSGQKANQSERARQKPDRRDTEDRDVRLLILFVLAWCLAIAALAIAFVLLA